MTLPAGEKLGPYVVVAPLGAGGMGEVYRARDTRLGREVAVKVLPGSLASDPDRLHRFETEARAASALNHPNILAIYDVGRHDGISYVVSELLEGQTLRERVAGTALPFRKAIDLAIQVARGLAVAHDKGIVHRDLKPDNIFVTRDGRAKILDFGLVKLVGGDLLSNANTATADRGRRTGAGTVLGTVGYMSPEQVRAQTVDHRSDIFSFGAVLYEMISGRRAFSGGSAVETMNAILKEDPPPISATERHLPPALERVVSHCLEKDPEDRFQSARDIAFDLEVLSGQSASEMAPPAVRSRRAVRWRSTTIGTLAAVALAAASFVAGRRTVPPSRPTFQPLTFRRGAVSVTNSSGGAGFAPDGRTVVYAARWEGKPSEIFSTQAGAPESRPLGLTDAFLAGVSRSGELAVLLRRPGQSGLTLARVPLGGGTPREVLDSVSSADWGPDGTSFVVARWQGARAQIEFPIGKVIYQSEMWISSPHASPRGDRIAFCEHPVGGDTRGNLAVVDLAGKKTTLSSDWEDIGGLAWSPDGDEIWFTAADVGIDRALWAVTLSGKRRLLERLPGHVTLHAILAGGEALVSHGTRRPVMMGYLAGQPKETDLSWLDFSMGADLSSDGRTVLFSEEGLAGGAGYSVYLRGIDGSPAVRLGKGFAQALSPDRKWALAVEFGPPARLVLLPTGAGEPRTLSPGPLKGFHWAGFFPDGRRILITGYEEGRGVRLYVQDLAGGPPRAIAEGVYTGFNTISPDGQTVAAVSGGKPGLYPIAGGDPRPIPGVKGGDLPLRWGADARTLYLRDAELIPARVFRIDLPTGRREIWKELGPSDLAGVTRISGVSLTPDGKSYMYTYQRSLSNLYLVRGLK